jgi:hypothetical protein
VAAAQQPAKKAVAVIVIALAALAVYIARRPQSSQSSTSQPQSFDMPACLAHIANTSNPDRNPFLNAQRAQRLRAKLDQPIPAREKVQTRIHLGMELLRDGDTEPGIQELLGVSGALEALPPAERSETEWLLNRFLGLAYMRLGEQQNCVAQHTSYSCLLPISGDGVHSQQQGSRTAIQYFAKALQRAPGDLESLWLLNVAHMTLAEYPDKVPSQWLLPPRVFVSDYDIKRFPDVAPEAGVAAFGRAGGVALEDFNGDGLLDIMCSAWGLRDQLQYFQNNGDGTFTERTKEAGLTGLLGGLNLVHADYNNDGHRDVLVLRGAWLNVEGAIPNSLLRNNGNGTFTDVTAQAGVLSYHPTQTAAWADFNSDGHLDLFIGNESDQTNRHPCELYRNNGDGTFTECAAEAGVAYVGFVKGVAAGDFDNDGWPDLYLSLFGFPNVLFHNVSPADKGGKTCRFEDVTAHAGVSEPMDSFPTWFWDFDNDGWEDIFVASYSSEGSMAKVAADYLGVPDNPGERARLFRNNHDGTFTDVAKQMRLDRVLVAMGSNFGDLDNDGWLDCYIGTGDPVLTSLMPNRMFRNNGGKVFQDVTTSGGFGHVQKGHAVAFGDIDNDGDQDIYEVLGGAYEGDGFQNALFENPGHGNHWITLRLRGTSSNRDAIGARIEVEVAASDGATRKIYRTVSTGGSFGSASLQQEIGLGAATTIKAVTIRWPLLGKEPQIITGLPLDSVVQIEEGRPAFTVLKPKRFTFAGTVQRASTK